VTTQAGTPRPDALVVGSSSRSRRIFSSSNILFKGYTIHAAEEEAQYEIKSDNISHTAIYNGSGNAA
jgi:hypothetical protein